ncbi:MAG: hypothetical protein ACI8RZ_004172 [Myxococcota bacterium]|jgi:hypothetical protein
MEAVMKRAVVVVGLIPLVLLGMLVLSMTWAVPVNSLKLWQMERDFKHQHHPADSTLLESVSLLGILDGNGNHCDFLVGQWRQGGPDQDAIRAVYTDPILSLHFPEGSVSEDNYAPDAIRYRNNPKVTGAYLVYEYDGMGAPAGDMRCW